MAFFARGKHLAAIREKGLTIESPQGNARLKVKVFEDPAEAGPVDVVMFAVKLWDTEARRGADQADHRQAARW